MNATDTARQSAGIRDSAKDEGMLLEIGNLSVEIRRDEDVVRPLDGMNLRLRPGQSIGLVGESGCGKTMTAYSMLRILPHGGGITSGSIRYRTRAGRTVDLAAEKDNSRLLRSLRGGEISMIFQEPMSAFSPVHTIANQMSEVIRIHLGLGARQARARVIELLDLVGIPEPHRRADDYPFQMSGGMCQRAMIAMALSTNPRLLIADEPTTALDVTVQAQVLRLIKRMQREFNLALMLITHDLGVVAHMVERIHVMYLGRVVERGGINDVFRDPLHPYTRALLNSIPNLTGGKQKLAPIKGSVPGAGDIPPGCPFHPRCPEYVGEICMREVPALVEVEPDHWASCVKYPPREGSPTN